MHQTLRCNITNQFIIISICGITALIIIVVFILKYVRRRFVEIVKNSSKKCENVKKLNEMFHFHNIMAIYTISKIHKSKAQFDRFDYTKYLENEIEQQITFYNSIINASKENITWKKQYQIEVEKILLCTDETIAEKTHIPRRLYEKYEREILSGIIQNPVACANVLCKSSYVSPKGKKSYYDQRIFYYPELLERYNIVCERIEKKATKEYQRKLMTDSLRYDIMKRDGFKCTLCGRSASDGVKLQVDHIIPVAKGGRTIAQNLRTLCDTCNSGKSDKYDAQGKN